MSNKQISIFSIWPLLISVILLLLNDLYFKFEFHNWFTGKLSDFCGLLLISLIAFSLFPRKKYLVTFILAILFVFWKSPYSEFIITSFNSIGLYEIGRVVDYTDLIAFFVFPASLYIYDHRERFVLKIVDYPLYRIPILILVTIGITGTSAINPQHKYQIKRPVQEKEIDIESAITIIKETTLRYGLKCIRCDNPTRYATYVGNSITLAYQVLKERNGIEFTITEHSGGILMGNSIFDSDPKITSEKIKKSLQDGFGEKFVNMEFTMKLRQPSYTLDSISDKAQ